MRKGVKVPRHFLTESIGRPPDGRCLRALQYNKLTMKNKMNQIIRIVTALACLTLLAYVITTQNIAYYQPYIGAACVLTTWLTLKFNRVWGSIGIMAALAVCWKLDIVMSWESVLIGLTMVSATSSVMLLLPEVVLIRKMTSDRFARKEGPPQYGDQQAHQAPAVDATVVTP